MSNYAVGHSAERYAADYLRQRGYEICDINWKTRYCEIDIVSEKHKIMHFIEVKYRKNRLQGQGFDYITPKKLKQMQFAAELWVSEHGWAGEYCLGAMELTGDEYRVLNFLPEILN